MSDDTLTTLLNVAAYALNVCKDLRLPRIDLPSLLGMRDATPEQKMAALKTLLSVFAQGLAVLVLFTMLWRIGAAILHILDVLFWPLAVPFKVLRWLTDMM